MEQSPENSSQRFQQRSAKVLALLAHAEDITDMLELQHDRIEQQLNELRLDVNHAISDEKEGG